MNSGKERKENIFFHEKKCEDLTKRILILLYKEHMGCFIEAKIIK